VEHSLLNDEKAFQAALKAAGHVSAAASEN
jgi:hypothetical protein